MERIDHSFHPLHPLFRWKWLFGESYWCASCHQHFFCGESFYCSICDFAMDSNCALMKPIECKGEPNIQHFSHQHPMPLIESFFKNEVCFACQSSCLGSPTYVCTKCKYFLHKRCAECPQTNLTHPSHKRHHLHLCVDHKKKITCKSCKRNICSFILSCSECNWNLCIECYLLPKHVNQYYFHFHHHVHPNLTRSLSTNSAEFTCNLCHFSFKKGTSRFECTICGFVVDVDCAMRPSITVEGPSHFRHFYHQHPMMLVVDDARDRGGTDECCFACHSPCILGVAYFSCTECKYFIHKSCAKLPLKIRHALHLEHPLILASRHTELITNSVNSGNLPIFHHCSTCQRKINPNGFFFLCCDHSCKRVWICVKCIFENPVINYEGHGQHRLCYVKKVPQILECNAYEGYCKLPATSVEICSTEYSMFRCVHCDFNLHLLCGPLPCTIKYKYHVHPLMLVDSVVENNSDEHCCDVCESERDSRICVYYCQECKFVAHVYCLISEIIKALRGGNVELRTVEINDHRRKKVSSSTLKFCTIVNDLPKDEKGVFQTHFEMTDFDRHSSTNLTRFTRDDFHRLIDWLNGYYCLKKQELEYPKSRMEFVTAEGYTIPKNLARFLVLVLRKYGDISRQSESTPEIKSIAFSFLCEVLNSMSTTKVTYITQYDLKEWYFYVNFARRRGFSVEFISEKLKDVVRAFLGLQAAAERSSEPDRFKRDLTRDILELQKELDDLKSESSSSFINWGEFTMECLDVALKLIEEDHVAGNLLQL